MLGRVALDDDVRRIATVAARFAAPGERLDAVLPTEPATGERTYLCAFTGEAELHSWVALDDAGEPVSSRDRVREAVSIAAICEVAEEATGRDSDEEARIASPSYLDELGAGQPIAGVMQTALGAVDELAKDVEGNYKLKLT